VVLVGLATLFLPAATIRYAIADIRAGRASRARLAYVAIAAALAAYCFARFVGFDLAAWNSCEVGA